MSDRRDYIRALLRQDLKAFATRSFQTLEPGTPFISSWHIDHLAWKLTQVATGEVRRLIVNMPPRYMKSLLASVAFPAWVLGNEPTRRILCLSHTRQLARTHARGFRTVVEADWCRSLFPTAYGQGLRLQDFEARTQARGYRIASAVTGSVLGVGADLIILDDPMRGEAMYSQAERRRVNELFDGTISTRLNNKQTGAIVIIMQRLHADDLVGHVLEQEDWEVVSIPVRATEPRAYSYGPLPFQVYDRPEGELLQPEREGEAELAVTRRRLGSLGFSAQYQQQPIPPDGAVIKRDWIRYYEEPPAAFDLVICSWDTASSIGERNDYSVGTVWGLKGNEFYLLDLLRGRYEVPDLRRHVIALHERHQAATTLIEETELGRALLHEIRRTASFKPILRKPRYDKEARLLAQSPKFEAGQVLLPRHAGYLDPLLHELIAFPTGAHDDQVDSVSQALDYLGLLQARLARHRQRAKGLGRPRARRPGTNPRP